MDIDYACILKLDEDFKNGLGMINPFICGLRTQNYVRLCRLWIDKLIHCSPPERVLRNVYLEQLCRHAEQQVLGPPFNSPPNEGPLQVIPDQFMIKQGVILARQVEAETSSWGDVSEDLDDDDEEEEAVTSTSCSTVTWHADEKLVVNSHPNVAVRKAVSTTSTGNDTIMSEQPHRRRFKRHLELHNRNAVKCRSHFNYIKQKLDLNDDFPLKESKVSSVCTKKKRSKLKPANSESHKEKHSVPIDDKSKEVVEIYNKKSNTSVNEIKIKQLKAKLEEIIKENASLKDQLSEEKQKVSENNKQLVSLKSEVLGLSDKLALVETMKETLEGEHKHAISGIMDTVNLQWSRVNTAIEKNDQLQQLTIKMRSELKRKEAMDAESIQQMQREWTIKQKDLEQKYTEKMMAAHSQTVHSYESTINELKKELGRKNKDISRLEKRFQEHCSRWKNELENIKIEMETSSKQEFDELQIKMNSYKSKMIQLLKYNKNVIKSYEQKISTLNKTKDMELWVQRLSITTESMNETKKLESVVTTLEEKFRKQILSEVKKTTPNEVKLMELNKTTMIDENTEE